MFQVYHTVRVLDLNCYNELLDFLREDSLLLYRVVEDAILLKEKVPSPNSTLEPLLNLKKNGHRHWLSKSFWKKTTEKNDLIFKIGNKSHEINPALDF